MDFGKSTLRMKGHQTAKELFQYPIARSYRLEITKSNINTDYRTIDYPQRVKTILESRLRADFPHPLATLTNSQPATLKTRLSFDRCPTE